MFCDESNVESSLLGQNAPISKDILCLNDDLSNCTLEEIRHIRVPAYKFGVFIKVEALAVDLLAVETVGFVADIQNDIIFGNALFQVFDD